jgi:hypothetical protein
MDYFDRLYPEEIRDYSIKNKAQRIELESPAEMAL